MATTTASWRSRRAPGADAIDERLHAERLDGRARRRHEAALEELPDGAFVLRHEQPWLVLGPALRRWTPAGYTDSAQRRRGRATLITPPTLVDALREGWKGEVPLLHPSAGVERRVPQR